MNRETRTTGAQYPFVRHLYHRYLEFKARRADYKPLRPALPLNPTTKQKPGGYLVEITNHCNINCRMCNTHAAKRPKKHMPVAVFAQLLDRIKAEGVQTIGLHTIGEPFVHPGLETILALCKREGVIPALSTNAQFPHKIKELYSKGLLYGLRFSIDGLGDTYEYIRKGAKWNKVVESLELVREINHGLHAWKLPLTIDCAVCSVNLEQVKKDFLPFMKRYTFPHMIRFGVVNGLSPDQSFFQETKLNPIYYQPAVPCSMVFGGIYFNNNGDATLCCRDYENDLVIGSALETPISVLWHSKRAVEVREAHIRGDIKVCNVCEKASPSARNIQVEIKKRFYG